MKDYKTLEELLADITRTQTTETGTEAAIIYQDLIGHSTEAELAELANGEYKIAFYNVYQIAYGTINAIRTYLNYSEKVLGIINDKEIALADKEDALSELEAVKKQRNELTHELETAKFNSEVQDKNAAKIREENEKLKDEIKELKAKLYDLLTV